MRKSEKIALGLTVLLACLTFITWTIGVLWHAPNGGAVNNAFNYLGLGFVIGLCSFACILFYNEEIKQQ